MSTATLHPQYVAVAGVSYPVFMYSERDTVVPAASKAQRPGCPMVFPGGVSTRKCRTTRRCGVAANRKRCRRCSSPDACAARTAGTPSASSSATLNARPGGPLDPLLLHDARQQHQQSNMTPTLGSGDLAWRLPFVNERKSTVSVCQSSSTSLCSAADTLDAGRAAMTRRIWNVAALTCRA